LVLLGVLFCATPVNAQDARGVTDEGAQAEAAERVEEGRLLFMAAQRAFDAGRYPDALSSFERSYELAEDPQILYNIAITLDRLRRDEEALEAFRMYLRLQPSTTDRRDIEARIRVIEDQMARRAAVVAEPIEQTPTESSNAPLELATDAPSDELEDEDYTVLDRWWFWTALVAVVGGGIAAAVIVSSQPPGPIAGDEGVVVEALTW
jgi:tetratricopeptide (TPR) repeat protein